MGLRTRLIILPIMWRMIMELKIVKSYRKDDIANPDGVIERMEGSWQAAYRNTQIALVATLVDCYLHGDKPTAVDRANRIVKAVAHGGNAKAVVEWLVEFGFVVGDNEFATAPDRETIESLANVGFSDAKALMWWTLKPQKPFEGWSFEVALNKVLADAQRFAKMAKEDPEAAAKIKIDMSLVDDVQALLAE